MGAMLTTEDNPHDPRTDYPSWRQWDIAAGYNTDSVLARIAGTADEMPDEIIEAQIEFAMNSIIDLYGGKLYKKLLVTEEDETEVPLYEFATEQKLPPSTDSPLETL